MLLLFHLHKSNYNSIVYSIERKYFIYTLNEKKIPYYAQSSHEISEIVIIF